MTLMDSAGQTCTTRVQFAKSFWHIQHFCFILKKTRVEMKAAGQRHVKTLRCSRVTGLEQVPCIPISGCKCIFLKLGTAWHFRLLAAKLAFMTSIDQGRPGSRGLHRRCEGHGCKADLRPASANATQLELGGQVMRVEEVGWV